MFSQVPPQVQYVSVFEPELPVHQDREEGRRQPASTVPYAYNVTATEHRYADRRPIQVGTPGGQRYPVDGEDMEEYSEGSYSDDDDDDYEDYDDNDSVWEYARTGDDLAYRQPDHMRREWPLPSHTRDVELDEHHYRVSSAARRRWDYTDGETIAIQRGPALHHHHTYTSRRHPLTDVNEDHDDGVDPHHPTQDSRPWSSQYRDAERVEILRTPTQRDAYYSQTHGYRDGGSETHHPHTRRSDSRRMHSRDVDETPVAILRAPVHSHLYRPDSQNYRDERYDDGHPHRSSSARFHSGTADEPRVEILRGPRTRHWHGGNDGDHYDGDLGNYRSSSRRMHSGGVEEEPIAILRRPEPKWHSYEQGGRSRRERSRPRVRVGVLVESLTKTADKFLETSGEAGRPRDGYGNPKGTGWRRRKIGIAM
ncbi:hypothetical protein BZA05DRAFT_412965 [Tricharina praecox]|uniref:uncharacterized protein n=1 Tax=Tricharina praecox TaxID=43433 RepID=UPI00222022C0|nr:uncharacterized protein BZA05DRAFT_412965 [Tricharina praecox]KAI5841690.1 hypothetical protein BZA05DRAFT_412965 [Tricharina praecox]